MNDHDEAHLYSDSDDEGVEICDACGDIVDVGELKFDEDSDMYVCDECLENPPDDM
ncbi:hypothetical protein [Actinomadura sp. KC216]|uniref:hypothetical protein n=1 Tax=Actinomadura sp. KC216 TaxID=2530370 RepID=UPI001404D44E|nr:hypothetical protein [Actinomadura sp. KC216]